jgi:hypothetical protein
VASIIERIDENCAGNPMRVLICLTALSSDYIQINKANGVTQYTSFVPGLDVTTDYVICVITSSAQATAI